MGSDKKNETVSAGEGTIEEVMQDGKGAADLAEAVKSEVEKADRLNDSVEEAVKNGSISKEQGEALFNFINDSSNLIDKYSEEEYSRKLLDELRKFNKNLADKINAAINPGNISEGGSGRERVEKIKESVDKVKEARLSIAESARIFEERDIYKKFKELRIDIKRAGTEGIDEKSEQELRAYIEAANAEILEKLKKRLDDIGEKAKDKLLRTSNEGLREKKYLTLGQFREKYKFGSIYKNSNGNEIRIVGYFPEDGKISLSVFQDNERKNKEMTIDRFEKIMKEYKIIEKKLKESKKKDEPLKTSDEGLKEKKTDIQPKKITKIEEKDPELESAEDVEKNRQAKANEEIKKYFPEEGEDEPLKTADNKQPEVTREFLDPEWEAKEKKLEELKRELDQARKDYVKMKLKKEKLWRAPMRFFRDKVIREKDQDVEWMKGYYDKALARYQDAFLEDLDRKKITEKEWDEAREYFEKEEKIELYNTKTEIRIEEDKLINNRFFKFVGKQFDNFMNTYKESSPMVRITAFAVVLMLGASGVFVVKKYMRGEPGSAKLVKERIAELEETKLSESLLESLVSESKIEKESPGESAEPVSESEDVPEDIPKPVAGDEIKEKSVKKEADKNPVKPGESEAEKVAKQKAPETIVVSGEFKEAVSELRDELTVRSAEAWKYIENKTPQRVKDLIRAMPREKVEEMNLKGLIERLNDINYRYTRKHSVKANPEKGEALGHWIERIVEINKGGKL